MKDIKSLIREQVQIIFKEEFLTDAPREIKTQVNFDWKRFYPDFLKNNLEIEGEDVILYHYGTDGDTGYLDPNYFGKNPYTDADVKQWNKKEYFSMFIETIKNKELQEKSLL